MSLHTFHAPTTTTEEIKTCTTVLLDGSTCTTEADRRDDGEHQVCRECGEPVCKRHSHNEATGYGSDRQIKTYGSLIVCITCNSGADITAIVTRLERAAEDAYEGKSGKAVRNLNDIVDDLIDVMDRLRDATIRA